MVQLQIPQYSNHEDLKLLEEYVRQIKCVRKSLVKIDSNLFLQTFVCNCIIINAAFLG